MKTLLKDMPEFAERIENNISLQQDIKDILDTNSEYSESRGEYVIGDDQFKYVEQELIAKLTEFVNQNYKFKGDAN